MTRPIAAILFGTVLFLSGCAIPRTAFMDQRMRREIPVVPHGSMYVMEVQGSAIPECRTPGGKIWINSPLTAVETYEWYRAALLQRGWKLTRHYSSSPPFPDPEKWEAPVANERGEFFDTYYAERTICGGRETMMFHLATSDAPKGGSNLELFFDGRYVWDAPTWVFNGIIVYPFIIVLQEGFLIVTPPLMLF